MPPRARPKSAQESRGSIKLLSAEKYDFFFVDKPAYDRFGFLMAKQPGDSCSKLHLHSSTSAPALQTQAQRLSHRTPTASVTPRTHAGGVAGLVRG